MSASHPKPKFKLRRYSYRLSGRSGILVSGKELQTTLVDKFVMGNASQERQHVEMQRTVRRIGNRTSDKGDPADAGPPRVATAARRHVSAHHRRTGLRRA